MVLMVWPRCRSSWTVFIFTSLMLPAIAALAVCRCRHWHVMSVLALLMCAPDDVFDYMAERHEMRGGGIAGEHVQGLALPGGFHFSILHLRMKTPAACAGVERFHVGCQAVLTGDRRLCVCGL